MFFSKPSRVDDRLRRVSEKTVAPQQLSTLMTRKKKKHVKRKAIRTTSYKHAVVRFMNGAKIPCVVANYDNSGARLKFTGRFAMPENVEILIPEMGVRRWAHLRWQNGEEAGFEFG